MRRFVEPALADAALRRRPRRRSSRHWSGRGRTASLAQTLLKLTAPACPTSTRAPSCGTSAWSTPTTAGRSTTSCAGACSDELRDASVAEVLAPDRRGLPKLWLTQRALAVRRARPEAFGPERRRTSRSPPPARGRPRRRLRRRGRAGSAAVVAPPGARPRPPRRLGRHHASTCRPARGSTTSTGDDDRGRPVRPATCSVGSRGPAGADGSMTELPGVGAEGARHVELVVGGAGARARWTGPTTAAGWPAWPSAWAGDRLRASPSTAAPPRPDPRSPWQPEGVDGPSRLVDHAAFSWTDAGWQGRPPRRRLSSTSCTSARSRRRAPSTAPSARLDHLVDLGVDAVELHAGRRVPGRRGLGLRRRRPVRAAPRLRRPRRAEAPRRRLPRPRPGRGPRRRLQPPRAGGQLPRRVRALLHRPLPHALGDGGQLRRRRQRRGAALRRRQRPDVAAGLPRRRAAARRRPRHRRHVRRPHPRGARHRGRGASAPIWAGRCSSSPRATSTTPASSAARMSGGYGLDAQWSDDFHHALHAVLTGERSGYYADFGSLGDLAKALQRAYVYDGRVLAPPPPPPRPRPAGLHRHSVPRLPAEPRPGRQPGAGASGRRCCSARQRCRWRPRSCCSARSCRCCSRARSGGRPRRSSTSPTTTTPSSAEAVSEGRRREFAAFGWAPDDVPDPQDRGDVRGVGAALGRARRGASRPPARLAPPPRRPAPVTARRRLRRGRRSLRRGRPVAGPRPGPDLGGLQPVGPSPAGGRRRRQAAAGVRRRRRGRRRRRHPPPESVAVLGR